MKDYVIETKQVTKSYGSLKALNHVNIHVKSGSIYGLVGDNGAGKSTLLKLLAGQVFAEEGEVVLFGNHGAKELERARKNIGCMIEQTGYFPSMTVEQMLKYYCIQKGIPDRKRRRKFLHCAALQKSGAPNVKIYPWARSKDWASPLPCWANQGFSYWMNPSTD